MAEGKNGFDWSKDGLGLVLFGVGAFALVLVVMSLFVDVAPEDARGTTALARGLVGALGTVPALLGSVGLAVLGALAFLGGRDLDLPRHALGTLGTMVGLGVLLGAFGSSTGGAGGALGAAIGGRLAGALTQPVGVLLGAFATLVPIWLAWGRGRLGNLDFLGQRRPPAAAATEGDVGGVSSEEAAALVPDEATLDYMKEVWAETTVTHQPEPLPPSPYPEDVRLKGEIPRGAQPLSLDARSQVQSAPEAPSGDQRVSEDRRRADLGVGADLAPSNPGRVELRAPRPVDDLPDTGAQALARPAGTTPISTAPEQTGPPKPAWEQPDLFGSEHADVPEDEDEDEDEDDGEALADDAAYDYDEELEDDEAAELEDDEDEDEEPEVDEAAGLEEEAAEVDEYGEEAGDEEEADEEEDEDVEYAEVEEDVEEGLDDDEELEEAEDEDEVLAEEDEELEVLDEDELQETVAEDEDDPAVVDSAAEREVVLAPHPRPDAGAEESRGELVHRAGLLIAERGRVAVSLLQRTFGLEFDEACEILDELQDQGLIGPYLGGQRRDILLSLDEWRRRVPSS